MQPRVKSQFDSYDKNASSLSHKKKNQGHFGSKMNQHSASVQNSLQNTNARNNSQDDKVSLPYLNKRHSQNVIKKADAQTIKYS